MANLNAIPEGWSHKKIGDISTIFSGGTPSRRNPAYYTGSIPWVKSGEVNARKIYATKEHISDIAILESSAKLAPANSILIAMYGATAGKVSMLMIDATINQAISVINCKNEFAINDFIQYSIKFNSEELLNSVQGSGQPNLSGGLIKNFALLLPPLPEQQKIAAILTSVDEVIEKTQAQINKLKDLKTGMMQELLTRGVGIDGKPHTEFKDSPVGKIPKSWDCVQLLSVLEKIDSGWSPSCIESPPQSGQWGVLKVSSVTRGYFLEKESKTLPIELTPRKAICVHKGDLLLTRANGVAELVGKCVMVNNEPASYLMMSDKILRLSPKGIINRLYLLHYFNSKQIRTQIEYCWGGSSGQKNISQADIKKFYIAFPPMKEQILIGKAVSEVDNLLLSKNKKMHQLQSLKKALMQDLLTGKVRVKTN